MSTKPLQMYPNYTIPESHRLPRIECPMCKGTGVQHNPLAKHPKQCKGCNGAKVIKENYIPCQDPQWEWRGGVCRNPKFSAIITYISNYAKNDRGMNYYTVYVLGEIVGDMNEVDFFDGDEAFYYAEKYPKKR